MVQHDPYATLGVSRDDGPAAIRGAFLDLVRRVHPATDAEPPFLREVNRAFDVLGGRPGSTWPPPVHLEPAGVCLDLLGDFEGERPTRDEVRAAFRANFTSDGLPKSGRLDVLDLEVRVEPATTFTIALPVFHPCSDCHGTGSFALHACPSCDGTGVAETRAEVAIDLDPAHPVALLALDLLGVRTPALRVRIVG